VLRSGFYSCGVGSCNHRGLRCRGSRCIMAAKHFMQRFLQEHRRGHVRSRPSALVAVAEVQTEGPAGKRCYHLKDDGRKLFQGFENKNHHLHTFR